MLRKTSIVLLSTAVVAIVALFAATIIKVFVRDTANVDTPYRILSFLVLGLMLVGASYLYHRFKNRILPAGEELEV